MTVALIALGLGAYAAFLLWRVRVEKGWVGVMQWQSELARFQAAMLELTRAIGEALIPSVRRANDAILAWHAAWLRSEQEVK